MESVVTGGAPRELPSVHGRGRLQDRRLGLPERRREEKGGADMRQVLNVFRCLSIVLLCSTALAQEQTPLDRELDRVWGKERDIRVIEKRAFEKDGRHEFSLLVGVAPNDPFFNYYPVGLRYDYYLLESLALEIAGAYVFHPESGLRSFVVKNFKGVKDARLPQRVEWYAGANVYWAPIYGKFSVFAKKIATFDLGFILGAAAIGSHVSQRGAWVRKSTPDVAGLAGLGFHFYLTELLALRADYRHYVFKAYDGGVRFMGEITLGFAVFTAAPK